MSEVHIRDMSEVDLRRMSVNRNKITRAQGRCMIRHIGKTAILGPLAFLLLVLLVVMVMVVMVVMVMVMVVMMVVVIVMVVVV